MTYRRRNSEDELRNAMSISSDQVTVDFAQRHHLKEAHEAVDVHVRGLTYKVDRQRETGWRQWLAAYSLLPNRCAGETRVVLKDVTFTVRTGQMLAILGSSGSGKTSLLDVIACRNKSGEVTGEVLLNGVPRTPELVSQCAAYVRQDDRLMASLTVRETLMFVAQLKLPTSFTDNAIQARVNNVITELGLIDAADTRIGNAEIRGISGGERRRVSIGIQMLIDPSLLFLDEPTSGLDSFTASHLVSTLSHLAQNRRTILMSIHQPRSNIFELFDLVMLLSGGRMVYYGPAKMMVDYFTKLSFPCPQLTNPCDFYVDLTTIDPASEETEESTAEVVAHLQQSYRENVPAEDDDTGAGDLKPEKDTVRKKSLLGHAFSTHENYPGLLRQFSVLFRRWTRVMLEDWSVLLVRCIQAVAMSVMLGVVYWDLQPTQAALRDHFGMLYMLSVMYPYLIIIDIIETCFKERRILYFELQDRLYKIEAYYFAKILSDLPFNFVYALLYVLPMYFMAGLTIDVLKFLQIFGLLYLSLLCSRHLAMMSSAIMPSFQSALFMAQTLFSVFIMSAGFFINIENLLSEVKWVSVVSYLRWSFQGLCLVEIEPLSFTCNDTMVPGTCVRNGSTAMQMYAFTDQHMWECLTGIVSSLAVFSVFMFVAIKLVPQQPEEHV